MRFEYRRGSDQYGTRQIDVYPVVRSGEQVGVRVILENTDSLSLTLGMSLEPQDLVRLQNVKTVSEAEETLIYLAERYPDLILAY
jgi:hypothetical protein